MVERNMERKFGARLQNDSHFFSLDKHRSYMGCDPKHRAPGINCKTNLPFFYSEHITMQGSDFRVNLESLYEQKVPDYLQMTSFQTCHYRQPSRPHQRVWIFPVSDRGRLLNTSLKIPKLSFKRWSWKQ